MISEFAFLNESFKSNIRSINFKLYNIVPCYNTDLFRKRCTRSGGIFCFSSKILSRLWEPSNQILLFQTCSWGNFEAEMFFGEKTIKCPQQNQTKFSMCQLCLNSRNLNCQKTMAPLCFPGLKETCISLPSGSEH